MEILAALVGAAAAFFLVVLNDWRRNRRIATKQLPALLRRLIVLVDSRHKGAIDARASIGRYLAFYNGQRPHTSLDGMTPNRAYFNPLLLPVAA